MPNAISKNARIRAIATVGSEVAVQRQRLFAAGFARIKEATSAGYYLEAIALIESLLADRLESRLCHLTGSPAGFMTLESVVRKIARIETDARLLSLANEDISKWRTERNTALHEMMKIEAGSESGWDTRIAGLEGVVARGIQVVRSVDRQLKALRR